MSVRVAAHAKLNLLLEVVGRRADGYHEIDSIFSTIDLHDDIELEPHGGIALDVRGGDAPAGPTNLAWRAAASLGVGARITLHKRIPAGAGLGGGSSDAASVLLGLDSLHGLGLGRDGLLPHARRLGADVPFFLRGGLARCRGIGDLVEPLPLPPNPLPFLLVRPALATSTVAVYGALDPLLTGSGETATVFLERFQAEPATGRVPWFNRLQAAAERLDPRLKAVRQEAERRYGRLFTMTGSGSCYFAPEGGEGVSLPDEWTMGGVRVSVIRVCTEGRAGWKSPR